MKIKNKILGAAMASALALASINVAHSAVLFQFNTNAIPTIPGNSFQADRIVFTSLGSSTLTVTDSNGNGVLDAVPSPDTFTETGFVVAANFVKGASLVLPGLSGANVNYEIFADFTPTNGTLAGNVGIDGATLLATFNPAGTTARLYLDTIVNGLYVQGAASNRLIGTLTAGTGDCSLPFATQAQGSCVIDFAFDTLGPSVAGLWTNVATGLDLAGANMRLDINVDQITPQIVTPFPGGPGSSQVATINHDGSGQFNVNAVPEPETLALFGLGLLGLGLSRRKRA